jgi:hypothetical protein
VAGPVMALPFYASAGLLYVPYPTLARYPVSIFSLKISIILTGKNICFHHTTTGKILRFNLRTSQKICERIEEKPSALSLSLYLSIAMFYRQLLFFFV